MAAGWYAWTRTASVNSSLARSVGYWAMVIGAIGFIGGFFGPMVFAPGANQGPLLGILITGPVGVLIGAIGGLVHGLASGSGVDPVPQRDLMLGWIEQISRLVSALLDGPSPDLAQASDKIDAAMAQHLGQPARP